LSVWGLAGAVLYLGGPLGAMTGSSLGLLMAPQAVQVMVLSAYLITRGLNHSGADAAVASRGRRRDGIPSPLTPLSADV